MTIYSQMPLSLETFIIADTHFGHQNILRLCNRPSDSFSTIQRRWKELVTPDDVVLHLGDLCFRNTSDWMQGLLRSLPGRKFLIRGNHDKQRDEWYQRLGYTVIDPFLWHEPRHGKAIRFSHRPDIEYLDWSTNVHGHLHSNGYPPSISPERDYRNVSVEVMNYEPVRLEHILYGDRYQSRLTAGDSEYRR